MTHSSEVLHTGTPLPLERFLHWEKQIPDKVCLSQTIESENLQELTWRQAGQQIRAVAGYLVDEANIQPGDHIAILAENCMQWILADLAIWMAGAVSVIISPEHRIETLQDILVQSEVKVVFLGQCFRHKRLDIQPDVLSIHFFATNKREEKTWQQITDRQPALLQPIKRHHQELATITYSPGSSDKPKGVMHQFNSLAFCASQFSSMIDANSFDRMLASESLCHSSSRLTTELLYIYQGVTVHFELSRDQLLQTMHSINPTLFFAVPRLWSEYQSTILQRYSKTKLSRYLRIPLLSGLLKKSLREQLGLASARYCFNGIAPLPTNLLKWYQSIGIPIVELYGLTECFGYSHSTMGLDRPNNIGKPNPLVEAKINADRELMLRSPANMTGYIQDPELTRSKFNDDGFLITGDLAVLENNGTYRLLGRKCDQFKSRKGKLVNPFLIENMLLNEPHINHCWVFGTALSQPMALVVLSEAFRSALTSKILREKLDQELSTQLRLVNERLNPHEKVKTLVVVSDLWTVENGFLAPNFSLKRHVLAARYEDRIERWIESSAKVQWEQDIL